MLTLSLLRHAKSSWADPGLDDYERPLAKRGANAAAEIGKYLKRQKLRPDLILCSGAVRTRATLELVLAELCSPAPEVRYDDALYRTSPAIMLSGLRKIDTPYRHVMMIGHNPELHALSLKLIGDGRRKDIATLATRPRWRSSPSMPQDGARSEPHPAGSSASSRHSASPDAALWGDQIFRHEAGQLPLAVDGRGRLKVFFRG
jgi:phosphohistidine phosphatase